jgi:hypothetical protein
MPRANRHSKSYPALRLHCTHSGALVFCSRLDAEDKTGFAINSDPDRNWWKLNG